MKRFTHYIQHDQMDWGLTCKNCACLHPQVEELVSQVPLSLLLLTFPGCQKGK